METTDEIGELLQTLRLADTIEDQETCLNKIISMLTEGDEVSEDLTELFVENGLLGDLFGILNNPAMSHTKVAQTLAEVAKVEPLRQPCVDIGFVPHLLQMLESDNISMAVQGCRALGNICYENDHGRSAVDEGGGMKILLDLLKTQMNNKETETDRLRTIACGFLLNLTNTNEDLQEKAIKDGALEILEEYLQQYSRDTSLCNMVLLTISSIVESDLCKEKISMSLCRAIVSILASDDGSFHQETILDLLVTLAEWDEVKDLLAETSLNDQLIKIIQSNTGRSDGGECQHSAKLASDLMVMLLTGDKSMEILFEKGEGLVFVESVKWLESDDEHLQLSGALAVGNFARNDDHCQRLVEEGIVDRLLTILRHQDAIEPSDATIQHAVLSALRNLAIPAANKPLLLKAGVLEVALLLSSTDVLSVAFKLLGVLRMLVDGHQEPARQLGMDRDFLQKLMEWSGVEEHAGVKGEATRLLASLIKNSGSTDVMKHAIKADGIHHLVAMATSEHVVMQNEALVALTLICCTVLADAAISLKEADLSEMITTLLKDKKTLPQILCNSLTLTKTICAAGNLREELVTSGISDITRELCNHDDEKVQQAAISVLSLIEDMPVER